MKHNLALHSQWLVETADDWLVHVPWFSSCWRHIDASLLRRYSALVLPPRTGQISSKSCLMVSIQLSLSLPSLCFAVRWPIQHRTFISVRNQPVTQDHKSAVHPSGVGKWVPASAGKAKAGMVHSISGWTRGVQVKLWDPLRTHAIPERHKGVFTTRRYTNPHLPLPYLPMFCLFPQSTICSVIWLFCNSFIGSKLSPLLLVLRRWLLAASHFAVLC